MWGHDRVMKWNKMIKQEWWVSWINVSTTEPTLVEQTGEFGSSAKARSRRSLHHFPIPRLFHVDFALQLRSWGKTDALSAATLPLLLFHRLSSPSPLCPLGFFYGRASNIWPLPCIRLHVSIQTRQYKKEHCAIRYTNFVCMYCILKFLYEVRPPPQILTSSQQQKLNFDLSPANTLIL